MRRGLTRAAIAITLVVRAASAQDDAANTRLAREAYDRGAAAYDAASYASAAVDLTRADELSPNVTVLGLALEAAVRARDPALAMELTDRVERRVPASTPLYEKGRAARVRFAGEVGHLTILCPPPSTFCKALVDGKLTPIGARRWIKPGEHVVELTADGTPEKRAVTVPVGANVEVAPTPPPPSAVLAAPTPTASPKDAARTPAAPASEPPRRDGLSPAWFWIGAAVTAAVGGVTAWSAVDTKSKHDEFVASPSAATSSAGSDAQLRTNLLAVVTAAAAVSTAALGVFVVGWSPGPSPRVTASLTARF